MGTLNRITTLVFDIICYPFRGLPPIWALTVISILTGILMLWIFGKTSNQDAIKIVRNRVRGHLMAMWLFGDDLLVLLRTQGRLFKETIVYMGHATWPMLVMLVPVLLILTQLNLRFSVKPLPVGAEAVVNVNLRKNLPSEQPVELEVPEGIVRETPGVRIDSLKQVAWRVRPQEPGLYQISAHTDGHDVQKQLLVGSRWDSVSALRTGRNLWEMLLYPGEPPIPSSSAIESIEVTYDPLPLTIFGFGVHWLVFFFVVSLAAAFAFRRALGVEI